MSFKVIKFKNFSFPCSPSVKIESIFFSSFCLVKKKQKSSVFHSLISVRAAPRRRAAAPPRRPSAMGARGSRRTGQRDALPMVGEPSGAPPEPPSNEKTFI